MVRFAPGDRIELVRNPLRWGPPAAWDRVAFRSIPNAAARAAALLSGDVDLIDLPLPSDLPRFRADSRFQVFSRAGMRMVFIAPDQMRAGPSPFVTALDGTPFSFANDYQKRYQRRASRGRICVYLHL
jgi:peptide/nickel transport system substrate-binding protein